MHFKIFLLLFSGFLANYVSAEENSIEVPRGRYPFMAFLYYQDSRIREENSNNRFFRSAVIIRPSWLLSAAIDPSMKDEKIHGFPDKTLLARAGAISINTLISLNEDDHEQEREIVQLIRPMNHSKLTFWKSDITLLKTVNPFEITEQVAPAPTSPLRSAYKKCAALMYVKASHTTSEDKGLLEFSVIIQKSNSEICGSNFHEPTMICATDGDNMQSVNYCEGNSGGPLVCGNGTVTGLQTYIKDDCQPPHKYQLLSKWDTFIKCGTEEKCGDEHCSNLCKVTNKDKREAKGETGSSEEEDSEEINKVNMRASEVTETSSEEPDLGISITVTSDPDVLTTPLNTEVAESIEEGESTTLTKVIEEEITPEQKPPTSSEAQVEAITSASTVETKINDARRSWFERYKFKESSPASTSTAAPTTAPQTKTRVTKRIVKVHHRSRQLRRKNSTSKMGIVRELVIVVSILLCAM